MKTINEIIGESINMVEEAKEDFVNIHLSHQNNHLKVPLTRKDLKDILLVTIIFKI